MSNETRINELLVEHLGIEPTKIVPTAGLVDDLGADSLDTIEIVMALEEEFGIEITEEEVSAGGSDVTVQGLHDLVNKKHPTRS